LPITSDTFARGLPPLIYKGAIPLKNVKVQLKNHKAKNIFENYQSQSFISYLQYAFIHATIAYLDLVIQSIY
jgi:hypothetical protein